MRATVSVIAAAPAAAAPFVTRRRIVAPTIYAAPAAYAAPTSHTAPTYRASYVAATPTTTPTTIAVPPTTPVVREVTSPSRKRNQKALDLTPEKLRPRQSKEPKRSNDFVEVVKKAKATSFSARVSNTTTQTLAYPKPPKSLPDKRRKRFVLSLDLPRIPEHRPIDTTVLEYKEPLRLKAALRWGGDTNVPIPKKKEWPAKPCKGTAARDGQEVQGTTRTKIILLSMRNDPRRTTDDWAPNYGICDIGQLIAMGE